MDKGRVKAQSASKAEREGYAEERRKKKGTEKIGTP